VRSPSLCQFDTQSCRSSTPRHEIVQIISHDENDATAAGDEFGREGVEARLRQLAAGHTDLIDIRICAKPTWHRHAGQEISIICQARGRDLVASRTRPGLKQALQHALEAFEREVRRMRDKRTDRHE
jgi:ribosome-associated translation inhibitor RaiA